jgi:hypothetical protein
MSGVKSVEKYSPVKPWNLPSGDYPGLWGGYVVTFVIGKNHYRAATEIGVRGMNIPCVVVVDKHIVTIKTVKEYNA